MNSVDKKLINFRCDLDVLDGFDEVCDFKRMNRTQILIDLMRKYISDGRDEMNKWNEKSWQKDFLNMKSHSPSDAKLLMGGIKGLKDAWRLGVLHVEYEKLKKIQGQQQQ